MPDGWIEADHGDVPTGAEDHVGGFRVGVDVELRRGHDVAARIASAHRDDGFHPFDDARFLADGERDVGVGTDQHERDGLRFMGHHGVDDEVHRMPVVEFERRRGQVGTVEPGFAVDLPGQHLIDDEGARASACPT